MKWLKSLIAIGALVCGTAHAFAPQAGSWVITSEVNGLPGRGFMVDVQNGLFGMQMYAYESSGQPTFYLAVGPLVDNAITTALHRYQGGRYFGSGPLSGTETASPGNVSVRFTSSTEGFMTLPGESEVAISRFEFGYTQGDANNLMGLWLYTGVGQSSANNRIDVVRLTTNTGPALDGGTGLVVNDNDTFGCEQISPDATGYPQWLTECVALQDLSNPNSAIAAYYLFSWSVNEGEGSMLDATSGAEDGAVVVRRIADVNDNSVEFSRRLPVAAPAKAASAQHNPQRLRQALRDASAKLLKLKPN